MNVNTEEEVLGSHLGVKSMPYIPQIPLVWSQEWRASVPASRNDMLDVCVVRGVMVVEDDNPPS